MMTPLIREIRKTFSDSYIAALTNPNSGEILLNNPHLDAVITDDLSKNSFWKTVKELRSYKFTDGLLLIPTERAAWQMFFSGINNRIGVGRKLYEVITFMKSVSRNNYKPLRHEADYCMDLGRAIGVKSDNIKPEIFLKDEEKLNGKIILLSLGSNETGKKIIIHTGSGKSSRNWSEDKYFELIRKLLYELNDIEIILTAKEMSGEFRKKVFDLKYGKIIFADDKISRLRDLICIISYADLLIASSTGPLHIASALDIKTIGLFCHRNMNCAKHWGALVSKAVNLEVSSEYCDSNCSPDKENCNFENGISISDVINNV